MTLTTYLAYVLACCAIIIVPGPSVTVIIANAIRHGTRAGLMNVLGTQAGLAIMLIVLAAGLQTIVAMMGDLFEIIRLAGAAYLIWLGIKMWRSGGKLASPEASAPAARGDGAHFWQGFIVLLSNPKALLFFGAFIPQFVDINHNPAFQTLWLGLTFMIIATIFDGLYAILAGRARSAINTARVRLVERLSGSLLILGGMWLALSRR